MPPSELPSNDHPESKPSVLQLAPLSGRITSACPMIGYPSSHQHTLSRPVEASVNAYQCSEPLQHTPSLDDCEAAEKRQSVWSAFWLEERPQAHVSPLGTFARRVLQQLSALRRKLLSRMQSMWAATNSACRRIRELAPFPCDSEAQPDIEKQFFRETKMSSLRSTLPTTTPAFGGRHSGNRFRRPRKTMGLKPGLSHKAEAMQQTRHSKAHIDSSAIDDDWEEEVETVLQFRKIPPKTPPEPLQWIQKQGVTREIPDRKKLRSEYIRKELGVIYRAMVQEREVNQGPFAKTTRYRRS